METTKTLKIAAIQINGNVFEQENAFKNLNKYTEALGKDKGTIVSSWWYLHGDLQEEVGYDKGAFLNLEEDMVEIKNCYFNGNKEYFDVVCLKDGIYDVEVIGFDKPCVGYFWITEREHIPHLRGLVCFKGDRKAVEYAERKYSEKSVYL